MNDMEPFSQPDELVVLEAERKRREHPPVRTGVGAEYLEARGAFKHLVQVKRARRRMTVFFVPVVAAFIFSVIACASLLQSIVVVTIPQSSRAHFLGWNILYNTQGFGPFFSVAGAARLTAAFYVQLLWSALLIGNRFFRMRTRDRDLGFCRPAHYVTAFLRLGRAGIIFASVLLYALEVQDMTNIPIRNDAFRNTCELQPVWDDESAQSLLLIRGNSARTCLRRIARSVGSDEEFYRAAVPDVGDATASGDNGLLFLWMQPVGSQGFCPEHRSLDQQTLETSPLRRCDPNGDYDISNWATVNDDCSSWFYNAFYENARISSPAFAEQWYCSVNMTDFGPFVEVYYETASWRRPIEGSCVQDSDPDFVASITPGNSSVPGVIGHGWLANLTEPERVSLFGPTAYTELDECESIEVSCVVDTRLTVLRPDGWERHFWRSITARGCKRRLFRSPTLATDALQLDRDLSNIKEAYVVALVAQFFEAALDALELLFGWMCC